MADPNLRGGICFLKVDGIQYRVKGSFTYNIGRPKREAIVGQDNTHGYKEVPQAAKIEGTITDGADLDLSKLVAITNATITLELASGKTIMLRNAWFAGDGNVTTEEGEIGVTFEGLSGEEVV